MNFKRILKKIYSVVLLLIVMVSIVWTCFSIIFFVRAHMAKPVRQDINTQQSINNVAISLPHFGVAMRQDNLTKQLFAITDSSSRERILPPEGGQLMQAAIRFNIVDSAYLYQLVYLRECGCPATTKNRYDLIWRLVNPETLDIFKEEIRKELTAEEINRYTEQLGI